MEWMCIQSYLIGRVSSKITIVKNNYHHVAHKCILVANLFDLNNKHH